MSFQAIHRIEKAQTYLDIAVKRALKSKGPKKRGLAFEKAKPREYDRIGIITETLSEKLSNISKEFPQIDELAEFYRELVKVTLDSDKLNKSLVSVRWAKSKIRELANEHKQRIRRIYDFNQLDKAKKAFLGRVSSVMKQIAESLDYLESARKTMAGYPVLKTGLFTICIAGFPNVGKTTLLSKLTTSTPEIKEYAFTTKQLNLGYAEMQGQKVQFIDTPGTLARPDKMNNIEKQAYLAIKYLADMIIYIYDLTEPYPLEDQERLLEKTKESRKPVMLYLSKTDLLEQGAINKFSQENEALTSIDKLKEEINKKLREK